ncbi:hypothetical protein [Hyalangium rubrum]|uniref:Lipoprotein n=1 Tax=Hyalangium rubrum TaxID=3103134 RepID=A0ABU5H3Q3_9BACT|nr:hypothetical protein [Hyalangium sp. s54d21]MDY7227985.1 hypothetical protein [Hyalangium sp. s54d21]
MTSGRFCLIAVTLAGTAVALSPGCGDSNVEPCTTCPPIEGRYTLEFAEGALPAECNPLSIELPEGPLEVNRAGSQLTGTVDGVALQGTVYQTYDFSLVGARTPTDGGTETYSFSGRYVPARMDGGTGQLTGSFNGNYSRTLPTGAQRCAVGRAYTATQQ